jgi:SAM-dependent methyltransferase
VIKGNQANQQPEMGQADIVRMWREGAKLPIRSTVSAATPLIAVLVPALLAFTTATPLRPSASTSIPVRWVTVPQLPIELALYETVFWEPLDSESLRDLIESSPLIQGKSVLEIGTGSGLLALCCWQTGAKSITATDINPNAVECAAENAARLGARLDLRLVPKDDSAAFSVIGEEESFDVIIANPPWEDGTPKQWSDHALYDPNFDLLRSLLVDARQHLNPGGKLLLAYGSVEAIKASERLCTELKMDMVILDDRVPAHLPDVFLPGITLGITPR